MSKKIEIFENTLLKLLVRRGIDADRRNVVLSEGELGYTVDTKKLYVGDGQTLGGVLVGGTTIFPPRSNILTIVGAVSGDLAYSTDKRTLYRFKGGSISNINSWDKVGGVYVAGNSSVKITTENQISLNPLSASYISIDALGDSLTLDEDERITLTNEIKTDSIVVSNQDNFLELPQKIKIGDVQYTWPTGNLGTPKYLSTNIFGELSWVDSMAPPTSLYVGNTAGQIPVGTIIPYISTNSVPHGWLLCNGQVAQGSEYRELSAVIGTTYGGNSLQFNTPNLIDRKSVV